MSIEESLKKSPVWWAAGLLCSGFVAGLAAYRGGLEFTHQETIPKSRLDDLNERCKRFADAEPIPKAQWEELRESSRRLRDCETRVAADAAELGETKARMAALRETLARVAEGQPGKASAPAKGAADPPKSKGVAGSWFLVDARTGERLSSFALAPDGKYSGGDWGRDYGRPNGLGANQYKFDGEALSFMYIVGGRAREDAMLVGFVRFIDPSALEFTVTGGHYGQGKNLGMTFKFVK